MSKCKAWSVVVKIHSCLICSVEEWSLVDHWEIVLPIVCIMCFLMVGVDSLNINSSIE